VDLRQLECFRLACEHRSFARAAEHAHLTATTFSVQISRLESSLGVDLFERTTHGVALTPAGRRLERPMLTVLERRNDLVDSVRAVVDGRRGAVRLGWPPFGFGPLGTTMLADTRERRPAVDISVRHLRHTAVLPALLDDDVDLVLSFRRVDDPGVTWSEPCAAQPRVLAVAAGSALAGREEVDVEDLAGAVLIPTGPVVDGADAWGSVAFAAARGVRIGLPATDLAEIVSRTALGDGVCLLPASLPEYYLMPGLAFVTCLDAPMAVAQIGRRVDESDPATTHVLADLLDTCASHPDLGGLAPRRRTSL
jgi:DNA-binding transcriptional LysR family regulator